MESARKGNRVRVHYRGTLADGVEFESSHGREPFRFRLGDGQVIPGFEQAVLGMSVGEKRSVVIPCREAYGARRDDLVLSVSPDQFPDDLKPEEGMMITAGYSDGAQREMMVVRVTDETVTLDANHPLAGRDLSFEIELVEIEG